MKFKNFIFQAWKVMEFSSQSWKIKAVYVSLVIEAVDARKIMTKTSNFNQQCERHLFWFRPDSLFVEELCGKKYVKQ